MKRMKRIVIYTLVLIILTALPALAASVKIPMVDDQTITINRSTSGTNEILATQNWDGVNDNGFQIVATVNYDDDRAVGMEYFYTYTLSGVGGVNLSQGAISHWILEVTDPSTLSEFTESTRTITEGPVKFTNSGNPYMPSSGIYGIKWDTPAGESPLSLTVSFYTSKNPVWGDFYAKCGGAGGIFNTAYNFSFGTDPDTTTTNFSGWVPTPNGGVNPVPVPPSALLLGSGLLGLGALGWRRKRG